MIGWTALGFFADDYREEKRSLNTIVGMHPDNMTVMQIPSMIPKLAVIVRFQVETSLEAKPIAVDLKYPDGYEHHIGDFDQAAVADAIEKNREKNLPFVGFVLSAVAYGLGIPKAGQFHILAKYGDEQRLCGFINVQQANPSSNASEQPSSQSQPAEARKGS
jgi:hypothetical protein